MHDIAFFVTIADRVRSAVRQIRFGRARHRVVPRHPLRWWFLRWTLAPLFHTVATRLAVRVDLAAHHALHPTHLVLVHADDGVGRVGLASRRRTVGLDLSTHLIGVFFKDGIHPCLFLDEWLTRSEER